MRSASHLANELGKVDRDHSTTLCDFHSCRVLLIIFSLCGCEKYVIYIFPVINFVSSYPCSVRHMESTSHLANEFGIVDRDHITNDQHVMYYRTPYV